MSALMLIRRTFLGGLISMICKSYKSPYPIILIDMRGRYSLTPFQGQAANVTPPPSFSGENYLDTTYTMEEGPYLIATTHAGIILGLYHEVAVEKGILEKKDVFGNVDDSYVQPAAKNCERKTFHGHSSAHAWA